VKDTIKRFIGARLQGLIRSSGQLKLAALLGGGLLLAGAGAAAPVNDNFASATVLLGLSGTTSGNNVGATMEAAEPSSVITDDNGTVNVTNSIWFQWTAPQSGNVTFDTIGSVDNNFNAMDTVLGAWTGTSLAGLLPVAGDDNQNSGNPTNSSMTFLAVAGTTYYIGVYLSADAAGVPGNYVLNWTEQGATSSGMFSFTAAGYTYSQNENNAPLDNRGLMGARQARATVTRTGGANGAVVVNYQASETIYTNTVTTNIYFLETDTTVTDTNNVRIGFTNVLTTIYNITNTYQNYNPNNGGFYNRSFLSSDLFVTTNNNGFILPTFYSNNIPIITNPPNIFTYIPNPQVIITTNSGFVFYVTNTFSFTNASITNYNTTYTGVAVTNTDAAITNGSLVLNVLNVEFPDFEMNENLSFSPGVVLPYLANNVLSVSLVGAGLDPLEDPNVLPNPTLGATTSTIMTFLSATAGDLNRGTFGLGGATNFLWGVQAFTNDIFNFERSTLACDKTVVGSGVAMVSVILNHPVGNTSLTAYYRIDHNKKDDDNNMFTLQAGSDYARPDNAVNNIATTANDFTNVTGSVTFPANSGDTSESIAIPITQDSEVKFDRDFQIVLYWPIGVTPDGLLGNVTTCDVTILFTTPPAGAVDCFYNPENNAYTSPAYSQQPGANGEVYAVVVQPGDSKAVIGGNFTGYNANSAAAQNHIARINVNGQLDDTFSTGDGFDGAVQGLALDANGEVIAVGDFHSFAGTLRNGVARLNTDGSLDGSFDPGYGANGSVLSTAIQPDGKILIAGAFTTYNNTNVNYVARLNTDGSLDTTFNPGVGPSGEVNSIAVDTNGVIYIGGGFTNIDGVNQKYIASLNADGSLNTAFNVGSGVDTAIQSVVVQTDGKVLIAGDFTEFSDLPVGKGIARLNTNGVADTTFNVGTGPDDVVYSMTLQPDGKILIGGIFKSVNQTRRISVARLLPNGWVDTTFMDTAYNQHAGLPNFYYNPLVNTPRPVYATAVQPDGGVLIGGSFATVGGDGGTRSVLGTVSNVRNTAHPRSNIARLIGGTTPGPGNIGLTFSSYSANISSPTFFVNVLRTNGILGPVAATFEALPQGTGPGYAAYGVDYTLNSTIATWNSTYPGTWMRADGLTGPNNSETDIINRFYLGLTSVTMNLISNNNANVSLNIGMTAPQIMDTFFLGGENIPLGTALGTALAPLTIVHNNQNPGVFNFSQPYYYVTENGGSITITVTRTSGTDNKVTVNYNTINGTALAGTDYTTKSGQLTFNSGVSSQTFSVPITSGSIARPDRVFNVRLSTPGNGATLGVITNSQIEIINNNITSGFAEFINGTVVSANTMGYGTNENTSPASVAIARLGGNTGSLKVNVGVTNGSAINGTNYTGGMTNYLLSWNDGDSSIKTITFPVLDDGVVTSNLMFNLSLYNALWNNASTTNLLGLATNATVTITNTDSAGTVEFTAPSYIVNENAGYAIIPVVRTGGSAGALTVSYSNIDGTATASANYGAVSGTLHFAPGQVSTNIIVTITNLNTSQLSPFYFYVVLNNVNPTNGLGTPSLTQVNIYGSLAYNNPPGQPDGGFSGAFNGPVLALALQGDGKLLAGGSFTQADGVSRRRIARLKTDGSLDLTFSSALPTAGGSDSVNALLNEPSGLTVVAGSFTNFNGSPVSHITRLNVNGSIDSSFIPGAGANNPIFALAQNTVSGQRRIVIGGSFTFYNGISRSGVAQLLDNGQLDTSFSPSSGANGTIYAVAVQPDGKIVIGGDFTTFNSTPCPYLARLNLDGSLDASFNPGTGPSNTVRALAVQVDGRILVGGTFTGFNGTTANHLVRLNANGSLDNTFVLGAGANGNVYTITVQPDTRIIVGGEFTIYNGVTRNRITRLSPDGTTDSTINLGYGADGSVLASVIQADSKIDLGGSFANFNNQPHANIVRINGGSVSGSGLFQFSAGSYTVDERGTNVSITVVRVGGTSGTNANGTGDIIIPFTTSDGTAKADTDHAGVTNYLRVTANLDFPPGEVLRTVLIPVFDDNVITPDLTVKLSISNAPAAFLGGQSGALLTIINDDSAISFSPATYSVPKNVINGNAVITIQRSGGFGGISSVTFNTDATGSAVPVTDYTPVGPVTVTFAAGVTSAVVNVPINNNGLAEGNRTIGLVLTNALNAVLASPSNGVVTIIDNITAPGQLSFSSATYTANANDGNATITVIRSNGKTGTVTANYTTTPINAVPGVNYDTTAGTATLNDGITNFTFTIPVHNNGLAIGPVSLLVSLSNPTNTTLINPTNATLTINNTNVVVAFAAATNTFIETAGIVPVIVMRFNNTNSTSTVSYKTTDGTAVSNLNYSAASGTVTFNPGEFSKTIPVHLLHNTNYNGTVAFNLNLMNPSAGVQIGLPNPTVIQITDAEAGISFTNSALSVSKGAGSITVTVVCANTNVEPVIVNSNTVPLTVTYLTADGTGVNGVDYTAVTGTLVFTNGNGTNTFTVPILNNGLVNGNKTFNVMLANPTAPGVLVPPSTATITIIDSNSGLDFSSANYSINKSGGSALITVLRTDNTNVTSTVNFIATNGTAVNGLNFTATNGTLIFTNGVTSQSFSVPIISTTVAQPDLTVLLQLLGPVNGILLPPSAATLTIHDDTGGFVIPAGSMLTSESGAGAPNGIIDSNETVTLQFAFRVGGGTNMQNVVAKIIPNSNVTATSPVTNSYGPLTYHGHSASRPFTFTAKGTNNQAITVNFNLYDVNTNNPIGTAVFGYTLGTLTTAFSNNTAIVINDNTNASPYPSVINVSSVGGSLVKATVTLNKLWHQSPSDVDALVVSPSGSNTLVMAHVGGQVTVTNVTLTFDDAATSTLTHAGPATTSTNKPSVVLPVRNFP
jgi:uncharacterized delta-60 repeat protein